ncbi:HD domain-containing protein [Nannocystis bainbridge]|uniref:HD domain-containing protein n=1 Tax=Nannocystis bainbridge TaxID=2995303 RepID=A0ABT5DQ63_9BACT|nr:HD domain-containing protein [Nannocystis bainbridge]MDC0715686.1 HD domain-containing protein [Nannocystis bainbridge]
MTPTLTIEKALHRHQRANAHRAGHDFFTKYFLLRERLTKVEYAQAMQGFAGGNDHGPQHIFRVLGYLDALLGKNPTKVLNVYELFLAMMAVLYHDVGILLGREQHAEKSAYLLSLERNDYVFDALDKEYMSIAVRDHSSSQLIEEDCKKYPDEFKVREHTLRIRRVAALVRLADEIDEDAQRAPADLEAKMQLPEASRFFWAFNQRVLGVAPDPNRKHIAITMQFRPEDVTTNFPLPGKEPQPFVRLAIEKILKINKERVYCNRFLPDNAQYTRLELTLLPLKIDSSWTTPSVHTLSDATTFEELWAHLPADLLPQQKNTPASIVEARLLPAVAHGEIVGEEEFKRLYDLIQNLEDELSIEGTIDTRLRHGENVTEEHMNKILRAISGVRRALGLPITWRNWPVGPTRLVTADAFNEILASINQAAKAAAVKRGKATSTQIEESPALDPDRDLSLDTVTEAIHRQLVEFFGYDVSIISFDEIDGVKYLDVSIISKARTPYEVQTEVLLFARHIGLVPKDALAYVSLNLLRPPQEEYVPDLSIADVSLQARIALTDLHDFRASKVTAKQIWDKIGFFVPAALNELNRPVLQQAKILFSGGV